MAIILQSQAFQEIVKIQTNLFKRLDEERADGGGSRGGEGGAGGGGSGKKKGCYSGKVSR